MRRIFVAINLPEEIKNELAKIQQGIIDMFGEDTARAVAKWVKKENLHITLLFIGDVPDKLLLKANNALKEAVRAQKALSLTCSRVCYGPPKKIPPSLIWLEMEKSPELAELVENIKQKAMAEGVLKRTDNRPFREHITLARIRAWPWSQLDPTERPNIEQNIDLSFTTASIELMESQLKSGGAEYKALQSIPLIQKV